LLELTKQLAVIVLTELDYWHKNAHSRLYVCFLGNN